MKDRTMVRVAGILSMIIFVLTIVGIVPLLIGVSSVVLVLVGIFVDAVDELVRIRELLEEWHTIWLKTTAQAYLQHKESKGVKST